MPTTITLEYPDAASFQRIRDDIDNVLRGIGGKTQNPIVMADDETAIGAAIIDHVTRQGSSAEAGTGTALDSNQAIVTDGDTFTIDTVPYTVSVVDNEILGFSSEV